MFDVISDVTFLRDRGFDRSAVHYAIDSYIAEAGLVSLFDILGFPDWILRPNRLRAGPVVKTMKSLADKLINERRQQVQKTPPDLLDLLLAGQDPKTQRKMNTAELRDNLLTFILAGHETTALTLAWALYLIANDLQRQDQPRTEIQNNLRGEIATGDYVKNLPFLRQIIEETLRLYPPAALISRTAMAADMLCGRNIQKGDTVIIPIYALHRHHLLWQDPDAFKPERFADAKKLERYAYLPIGDGPRFCIRSNFAINEAIIILASLLKSFRFNPVLGRKTMPKMILTSRPTGGVWLTTEKIDAEPNPGLFFNK